MLRIIQGIKYLNTLSTVYILFSIVFVNNRDYFVSNSLYHNINSRNIVLYFINMWKWTKHTILIVSMFSIWDILLIMKHAVLSLHNKEFMWVFHATNNPSIKIAKKVCNTQSNSIVRTPEHKVKIIGDSHLKGSAVRINQYRNTKYKVTSFIKPGANINHLVHSQDNELKCLGKKDVILINGGTNDMDNYNCKVNDILKMLYSFIVKYSNTNIITVNLPQRHDQQLTSKSNLFIQAFNHKLNNITKRFNHVSVVEMYFIRDKVCTWIIKEKRLCKKKWPTK